MLTLVIATMLAAGTTPVTEAPSLAGQETKYCRAMVSGQSRSGDVTICRTKAHWAAWEACQGATRYCSPAQKKAIGARFTPFAMNEDSRITCRIVRATGSRLGSTRMCMAQREWQRMWDNGQEATRDIQDTFSKQTPGAQ